MEALSRPVVFTIVSKPVISIYSQTVNLFLKKSSAELDSATLLSTSTTDFKKEVKSDLVEETSLVLAVLV